MSRYAGHRRYPPTLACSPLTPPQPLPQPPRAPDSQPSPPPTHARACPCLPARRAPDRAPPSHEGARSAGDRRNPPTPARSAHPARSPFHSPPRATPANPPSRARNLAPATAPPARHAADRTPPTHRGARSAGGSAISARPARVACSCPQPVARARAWPCDSRERRTTARAAPLRPCRRACTSRMP